MPVSATQNLSLLVSQSLSAHYDRVRRRVHALVLAVARRTFRSDAGRLEPIRCLQYFVPVVDELIEEPPLPEYLDYLKSRLINAGVLPPA